MGLSFFIRPIVTKERKGKDKSVVSPNLLRECLLQKNNGKKRPLGIPTLLDRAMQALYLIALEPVTETMADGYSYGLRRERSTAEAIDALHQLLNRKNSPGWILKGDIKRCFDHINHEWLSSNVQTDKVILEKWLKSAESREILEEIKSLITSFLAQRGLSLSKEKTRVTHVSEGNLVITNWGNCFKHVVSKEAFEAVDHVIVFQLKRWAFRRHTNKSRDWVKNKYFHSGETRKWVFAETVKKDDGARKPLH